MSRQPRLAERWDGCTEAEGHSQPEGPTPAPRELDSDVTWDGSETQNDKATAHVNGQAGTITDGIGAIPLNHSVLNAAFEDRITPNGTAVPIFKDDGSPAATPPVPPQPDGLSFSGTYKVVFIAFPMEAYGTADDKADLVSRVKAFFGA